MTADLSKQEWKEVERLRPRAYEGEYALTPKAARLVFRALAQREAELFHMTLCRDELGEQLVAALAAQPDAGQESVK